MAHAESSYIRRRALVDHRAGVLVEPRERVSRDPAARLLTLVHTAWATYEHHAGFYLTNHFDASFNNTNPVYNYTTCNLGLHTAHHYRPGVHWSLLPALHAEIVDRIPARQIHPNFW